MSLPMTLSHFNYKTSIAVRSADLNAFGMVHHSVYLTYFEIAQLNYWRQLTPWNRKKQGVIIGRAEVKFIKPIIHASEIYAYVRTTKVGNCSFEVEFALALKDQGEEKICTTGTTTCIFFDFETHKPIKLPEDYRERLIAFEALEMV